MFPAACRLRPGMAVLVGVRQLGSGEQSARAVKTMVSLGSASTLRLPAPWPASGTAMPIARALQVEPGQSRSSVQLRPASVPARQVADSTTSVAAKGMLTTLA